MSATAEPLKPGQRRVTLADALAEIASFERENKLDEADDLANQAQVDAKLAQSKADSAKAQLAANALQEDIRVLREELNRASQ